MKQKGDPHWLGKGSSVNRVIHLWITSIMTDPFRWTHKNDPINTRLVFKDEDFSVNKTFPHPPKYHGYSLVRTYRALSAIQHDQSWIRTDYLNNPLVHPDLIVLHMNFRHIGT